MAAGLRSAYIPLDPDFRTTWSACIEAQLYLNEFPAEWPCYNNACQQLRLQNVPRSDCTRCFFCLQCRKGGLCLRCFKPELLGGHTGHPRLRIYSKAGDVCVRLQDLPDNLRTNRVAVFYHGANDVHFLRSRPPAIVGPLLYCRGCRRHVANEKSDVLQQSNETHLKYCCIQCLLNHDLEMAPPPPPAPQTPPPALDTSPTDTSSASPSDTAPPPPPPQTPHPAPPQIPPPALDTSHSDTTPPQPQTPPPALDTSPSDTAAPPPQPQTPPPPAPPQILPPALNTSRSDTSTASPSDTPSA